MSLLVLVETDIPLPRLTVKTTPESDEAGNGEAWDAIDSANSVAIKSKTVRVGREFMGADVVYTSRVCIYGELRTFLYRRFTPPQRENLLAIVANFDPQTSYVLLEGFASCQGKLDQNEGESRGREPFLWLRNRAKFSLRICRRDDG